MVEARVLFNYVDKYTGTFHLMGSVVKLEDSRAAELKKLGAVDFAERPKTAAKEEAKTEEPKKEAPKKEAPKKKAPATKRTSK